MRNGLIGLVCAVALASTMATNGCKSSTSSSGSSGGRVGNGGSSSGGAGSGGSPASGGSSGSGGQTTNCPDGSPCGGDVVGTWNVTSSCLNLSGNWDVRLLGMGCPSVPVTGSLQVNGTWTADSNGSYSDNTTTTGSITFPLDAPCLTVSSVPVECSKMESAITAGGWATATCLNNASGQCNCSATANQTGGIGVVSPWASDSGTYTTSGSGLNTDGSVDYSYCVSGNTLTMIPKPTILPVTGTVVLQKISSGAGGAGGAGGSGGATTGAGGKSSAGGASGTGGASTGSGGRSGTGGASTGSGGRSGTGGATAGAGGATTGSGGKTGMGGTTATGGTTAAGGNTGSGGTTTTGGTTSAGGATGKGPCDIYAAASNKCVAAHSTVRALFAAYSGSLYQVKRTADGKTQDIGVAAGGLADSAAQDAFCTTACVITKVYDQSGNGNFVEAETADSSVKGNSGQSASNATQESLNVSGHKVYSLYMKTAQAYWRDGSQSGMPTGSAPQGIYMVTSGKHYGSGCCFDYGNGPTSRTMSGGGTMDALNFSNCTMWGTGNGSGPWVMADLEGGLYAQGGGGKNDKVLSMTSTYVTAIEKNDGSKFALKGADATSGNLTTFYEGKLPSGYTMKKQGAIILGSGGDCCYSNTTMSQGTLYEGAIVTGYPSDATEDAIQANIVSAGYGK